MPEKDEEKLQQFVFNKKKKLDLNTKDGRHRMALALILMTGCRPVEACIA